MHLLSFKEFLIITCFQSLRGHCSFEDPQKLKIIIFNSCISASMPKQRQNNIQESQKQKEDIVVFLMENAYKQNKIDFYTNLEVPKLEDLISSVFGEKQRTHEQKVFVVSLLKKNTFILSTAFNSPSFNYSKIFGFLTKDKLSKDKLNTLQEIMLPFCKKFPEKVLGLLRRNWQLKEAFFKFCYLKPIFKILYTIVFCLEQIHIEENQRVMQDTLQIMTFSLFEFSLDKISENKKYQMVDYASVPGNYKDFLADLAVNLSGVQLRILLKQVQLLNVDFIQKIISQFDRYKNDENCSEYCQNLILILINIAKIFQSLKINHEKTVNEKLSGIIQSSLLKTCAQIASKIPYFTDFLLTKSKKTLPTSSGEVITVVGMVRYRILELIQKILSINELQDLKIDFDKFDFLPVVELYISRHKWNNITHNLVLKITQLLISRDYKHFKERHILDTQNYSHGFFGNLIANFRNRKYIFLHSLRMMNQGNRYPVYELSKLLVNEMSEKNDLSFLVQNFKVWKQFMEKDMKEFQLKNQPTSKLPNTNEPTTKTRLRHNSFELGSNNEVGGHYGRSLQTFQQVMLKLQEEQKWSPKLKPQEIDKSKLIQFQMLDSLSSFALQKR